MDGNVIFSEEKFKIFKRKTSTGFEPVFRYDAKNNVFYPPELLIPNFKFLLLAHAIEFSIIFNFCKR